MGMFDLTPEERLSRAIIDLQNDQPFFAHILLSMKFKEMPANYPMQTIGVSIRGELMYAKDFVEKCSRKELAGCMCHEVLHLALLHFVRAKKLYFDKDQFKQQISNIAQDVIVNQIVLTENMNLPDGAIPVDTYADKSKFSLGEEGEINICIENVSQKNWEQVYDEIMKQIKDQKDLKGGGQQPQAGSVGGRLAGHDHHDLQGDSDNNGENGDGESESMSSEELSSLEQEWQSKLAEAAMFAKQQGKLPAGVERVVNDLLNPQVKWSSYLMRYIKPHIIPTDWTYQKPHKKSQALKVYMPNVLRDNVEVEVLVDTSGSISEEELKNFLTEIVGIANAFSNIKLTVSYADTEIAARKSFTNPTVCELLAFKPKGGGGTDMEGALVEIKNEGSEAPVTIVLTDGYTNLHKSTGFKLPFEVIWVSTTKNINFPYGQVINLN